MKTVYLSLGANLGDREASLRRAVTALESPALHVCRISSVYETEPRDVRDQPWFLNIVVEAETELFPRQLLAHTQRIERQLGRRRATPKGPRTIDVDILLYGSLRMNTAELTIPHPRLHERRFVLEPLAELAPELRHPVTRRTVAAMLAGVQDQVVRRVGQASACGGL